MIWDLLPQELFFAFLQGLSSMFFEPSSCLPPCPFLLSFFYFLTLFCSLSLPLTLGLPHMSV